MHPIVFDGRALVTLVMNIPEVLIGECIILFSILAMSILCNDEYPGSGQWCVAILFISFSMVVLHLLLRRISFVVPGS